jgi:hypothetical protein
MLRVYILVFTILSLCYIPLCLILSVIMLSGIHASCHINIVMLRVVKHNVVCNAELHILLLC